jgi:hypothetical protein
VAIAAEIVPIAMPARPLIDDLPDRALSVFMEDIARESQGAPAHYRVRKFLKSLPVGLTRQTYIHRSAGAEVRTIEVGSMSIAETPVRTHLVELAGVLVGVGFEPGRYEIKVRANTGELVTFLPNLRR